MSADKKQTEVTSFFKRFDSSDPAQVAQKQDRQAKERAEFEKRQATKKTSAANDKQAKQQTERDRKRAYRAKRTQQAAAAAERLLPGPLPISDHAAPAAPAAAPTDDSDVPPMPTTFLTNETRAKRQSLWQRMTSDERLVHASANDAAEVAASISQPAGRPGRKPGKRVRTDRSAPEPKKPKRNTDHFLHNKAAVQKLHQLVVERTSRKPYYKVRTSYEFAKKLAQAGLDCIARSTLESWFTFVGSKAACAEYPKPKQVYWDGRAAGFNKSLRRSTGRKAVLAGAEPTLQRMTTELRGIRAAGVSLKTGLVQVLLVDALIEDGHKDKLSPHLYDIDAEEDKSKFGCSPYWLRSFMISRLGFSWRVGTKAAQKLPDDWEELRDKALMRIAALATTFNIPKERVFMADETFLFYTPESKCAPSAPF